MNADNFQYSTVAYIVASTGSRSEIKMMNMQIHDSTSIADKVENGK